MSRILKVPVLKWKPGYWWALLLLAILVGLVVMNGAMNRDDVNGPSPWSTPEVAPSTPIPTTAPGWWQNLPAPDPLYPTSTPGGSS